MNAWVKLIIGLLVTAAGLAWYVWGSVFGSYINVSDGVSSFDALLILLAGGFGAFLVLMGLLVTWIEMEDLRDSKSQKKEPEVQEEKKPKKKR
ncbi:MAG: hypothetical protein JW727_01425 [Candidatus Aenigmarchaeota archaeon]|nr:hypothetical protein [Candidatus Aenigmarchaeota archaeon]